MLWGNKRGARRLGLLPGDKPPKGPAGDQRVLGQLAEAQDAGLVVWQDGVVYANPAAARLFGRASAEALCRDRQVEALFGPDSVAVVAELLAPVHGRSAPPGECEARARRPDAEGPWLRVQSRPVTWQEAPAALLTCVDIGRQKQAEAVLADEEILVQAVLDSVPREMTIKDTQGRYLWVNQQMERRHAASHESLAGLTNADLPALSEPWKALVKELEQHVVEHGEPGYLHDAVIPDPTGAERVWRISKHPLRNAAGAIVGVIGQSEDVTERVRIEQTLNRQRRLLQAVLDQVPIAVAVKGLDRRYLVVNRTTARFWGAEEPSEIVGKLVEEMPRGTAAERAQVAEMHKHVLATGEPAEELEMPFTAQGGRTIWVHLIEVPLLDEQGQIAGVIGITEDVTARREAAANLAQMAAALEQAGDAVFITDPQGRIQYVNAAFERLTGYSRAEAIGQTPRLLKSGLQSQTFYEEVWGALLRGEVWKGRYTNRRKDGTIYHTDSAHSPIRDGQGRITAYLSVQRDVSQQVELDERLLRTQRLEAIGTLAGGIAHDFNNVLMPIMGYTEMLRSRADPASREATWLQVIAEACERARDLVERILLFTRQVDSRHMPMRVEPIIQEVLAFLRSTLPATIELHPNVREDATILGSPGQMHQVLMNLCINATHAMPAGGTLTLELNVVELREFSCYLGQTLSGRFLHLGVTDTGMGMSEEVQSHIFEPFYTTKPTGEGTGLGLATVFGIVRAFGGALRVRSAPGAGSTFDLYFPVTEAAADAEPPARERSRPGNERVLVVDDEPAIADLTRQMLEELGYRVTACTRSPEALALLEADPSAFDAVVSDRSMPELSGDALAQRLRGLQPNLPIVLCTGLDDQTLPETRDPFSALLHKPYRSSELSALLRRLLDLA